MIWPFSSRIARLQNSVTYERSWVTRTITRARLISSRTRAWLRARNDLVAGAQHLVEQEDVGRDRGGDREAQAGLHPHRVGLDRRVDEGADVGELDDRRREPVHLAVRRSRGRRRPGRCCRARSAPGRSRRRASAGSRPARRSAIAPSLGSRIPARASRSVLLPAPLGPIRPIASPWKIVEVQVAERPEVGRRVPVAPEHPDERALDRGPPRQAQVVADPQAADVDRDGPGRRLRRSQDPREGGFDALEEGDREDEEDHRDREQDPEGEEVGLRPVVRPSRCPR